MNAVPSLVGHSGTCGANGDDSDQNEEPESNGAAKSTGFENRERVNLIPDLTDGGNLACVGIADR